ncbi:MAG: hypothetical protein LBD75_02630 [Candidatus Peribacteria bacterium]|jgi:hypothetical protein|nr:hypothetical protein [Candidatus Peribacteria bacterium]
MLFTLNEQGNINRQSVEEHQISLKDFSTSFRFFQEYLSKNDLGKQIIPIMIQKFIQAIDQQLVQHAGEIPEEITQEWTKSKDDIERKRKITLTEFGGYVEKLFSGRLHKKAPLDNLEIAPILGKIYKQVSFPLKEITQELEQQNIISAEQGERLFEKGNKWSTLATNLDCIVTGDNQKQLEKIQEKKKRTSQFQNFFTATIPDLQDLMKSLPIPPKTPEDRNKLIRKNIVQRNNAFLQSIPKDDIELQVAMRDYMEKVKDTMYTLLDLTQKEINIETPNGTLTFPVEKSIGEGKGMLDMKFDLTIPDEAEEFLSADTSPLKGQFFTVEDQSGKKQKLTEEYVVELTDSQGNKKTGKLVETVDSQKPLPPALQQKIDKEGENNLRFLVDEQGNPIEAYTDEELKQSTLTVKDRKMKLEGEDLQSFVGQVLSMQVGGFDSQSEKAEKFFAKIPSPNKEILLEEKEQQRRDFLTYFQEEVKGHPFEYDKYQANQDNEDNQKLSLAALEKKEAEA